MSALAGLVRQLLRRYRAAGRHRPGRRALSLAVLFGVLALQGGAPAPTLAATRRLERDHTQQDGPSNVFGAVALGVWAVLLFVILKVVLTILTPGA